MSQFNVDTDLRFDPDRYSFEDYIENPPNVEPYYEKLEMNVDMLLQGIGNLVVIEASGGLGKSYNIKRILAHNLPNKQWTVKSGKTTPLALYQTLYMCQDRGHVLFLDDISGLGNDTAMELLKAATDTEDLRKVSYSSSRQPDHPVEEDEKLPFDFIFRGKVIICSNDLPDDTDSHFEALLSRASTHYKMDKDFDYETVCEVIREVAKIPQLVSDDNGNCLTVPEQQECAEWIIDISSEETGINLRTLEHVCNKRMYGKVHDKQWTKMAIDDLGMSTEQYIVYRLKQAATDDEITAKEAEQYFIEETSMTERTFYNYWQQV